MPITDPTEWFDNPNVYIEDEELLEQAAALEPTLLHGRSRIGTALWVSVVSMIAGAFGGFTFGDEVRSSWLIFAAYLAGGATLLRVLHPVSTRLVGPTGTWHALQAFFWSFLLATIVVLASRVDTAWLRHTVSIGSGLLVGLLYGSLNPGVVSREDAWMLTSLPLAPLSTWSATAVQRAFDASTNPPWSEAYSGVMAASVFMVPMTVLFAIISSRSNGLAKMATLYLHNDNFTSKAIEYLDEAIALSPKSASLYNMRGIAHSKAGDASRADADFRKVSELSPRAAEAHMNLGVDLMQHEQFDRAIDALRRATEINPKLAAAFSNLGTAYQKKGELDAAIESYSRAISLRARYPIAFSNRSYAYFLKGEHDLAIADARHAIELDADLAMAHTNLGHALAGKGDIVEAARNYRRALALGPNPQVAEETLKALERMGVSADDEDEEPDDE